MATRPESFVAELARARYQKYPLSPSESYLREFNDNLWEVGRKIGMGVFRTPYADYYDDYVDLMKKEINFFRKTYINPSVKVSEQLDSIDKMFNRLKGSIANTVNHRQLQPFDPIKHAPKKEITNQVSKQTEYFSYRPTLKQIGIGTVAIWASAELYHAYKTIKTEEWEKAGKLKPALLATRAFKNMVSRPSQIIDALEKKLLLKTNQPKQ